MYLFILIVGVVLFPQAHSLNCYNCISGATPCPQMQCPDEKQQCAAVRLISYDGSTATFDMTTKSCLPPQQCLQGSINSEVAKIAVTSKCCSSDLCNDKAPEPPKTTPNGKKCYYCDGPSNCTVDCEGDENHCIKASVKSGEQTSTIKGCATKSMCLPDDYPSIPGLSVTVSCCEGDYCNGADGASSSILLLLTTMLISNCFFAN